MQKTIKKILAKITPSTLINFEYPDPTRVLGLSTSHWTDVVDWKVAKEAGIKFAYIKAFNGVNNSVKFWKENYEGAMKEGIKVGAYSWLYPPSVASPGTQARKFATYMKDFSTQLPNCIDFEWTSPNNPNSGDLWGFVKPYEDETGKKPAIYTSIGYWNQYGSINTMWADYPLWQAQYRHGEYDIIKPWTGNTFLQWTEKGEGIKYGVPIYGERACELNYYNGTDKQFYELFGGGVTPPIDPPLQGETMKGTVITTSLNVRNAPVNGAVINGLFLNNLVEADRKENGWWHLTMIRGEATIGENWSYEGATQNYIRTDSDVPPTGDLPVLHLTAGADGYETKAFDLNPL